MGPTGRRGRSRLWCLELIGFRTYRLANLQGLGLIGSPVDHPHPFPSEQHRRVCCTSLLASMAIASTEPRKAPPLRRGRCNIRALKITCNILVFPYYRYSIMGSKTFKAPILNSALHGSPFSIKICSRSWHQLQAEKVPNPEPKAMRTGISSSYPQCRRTMKIARKRASSPSRPSNITTGRRHFLLPRCL